MFAAEQQAGDGSQLKVIKPDARRFQALQQRGRLLQQIRLAGILIQRQPKAREQRKVLAVDPLIRPFQAGELLQQVAAHLSLARLALQQVQTHPLKQRTRLQARPIPRQRKRLQIIQQAPGLSKTSLLRQQAHLCGVGQRRAFDKAARFDVGQALLQQVFCLGIITKQVMPKRAQAFR